MSKPSSLRTELAALRSMAEDIQQKRQKSRSLEAREDRHLPETAGTPLQDFSLSVEFESLCRDLQTVLLRDRTRYVPHPSSEIPPPRPPSLQLNTPLHALWGDVFSPPSRDETASPEDVFLSLMAAELEPYTDERILIGNPHAPVISKLKKVQHAFNEKRLGDAQTLLRMVLQSSPHNPMVLFLLSQFLYMNAIAYQQNSLPEARDFGQKCMIHSDKLPPEKLAYYQYQTIVTESFLGPERAYDWLKESSLLATGPLLSTGQGLMAYRGALLLGWALLANTPPHLWREDDFLALQFLTTKVLGGASLYLGFFRPVLIQAATERQAPWPHIPHVENEISRAFDDYQKIATSLSSLALDEPRTWTLRNRYLHALAHACPLPSFDAVLLRMSLNGEEYTLHTQEDQRLKFLLEEPSISYWKTWMLSLTTVRERHQSHLIPAEEALDDVPFFVACNRLLLALQHAEQERIKPAIWNDIRPWMIRWQLDHLLAAGSGSNKPRQRFAPNLPPFTLLYRRWSEPVPTSILASEIITENAQRSAFASMFEILAAFEGAVALLDSPHHGLQAMQKKALAMAKEQYPARFAGVHVSWDEFSPRAAAGFGLPVLFMGGAALVFLLARNWQQMTGLLFALIGAIGLLALLVFKKH